MGTTTGGFVLRTLGRADLGEVENLIPIEFLERLVAEKRLASIPKMLVDTYSRSEFEAPISMHLGNLNVNQTDLLYYEQELVGGCAGSFLKIPHICALLDIANEDARRVLLRPSFAFIRGVRQYTLKKVTFRNSAGMIHLDCVDIDPHRIVPAGSLLLTL